MDEGMRFKLADTEIDQADQAQASAINVLLNELKFREKIREEC